MADRQTQKQVSYKKSLSGSIGAGMKSLFGSEGRRYYVLEHKVSSEYHKAGESQKIIVDQIELGRDSQCQVRFDDKFLTVSRHHAAIVKDGDNWKLIHLSKENSTYLNGQKIETEWYLQNGDEIQLSTNGPKLGFIVPQGEKSLVKSIGLSARLSLFRQQALRPYRRAITAMSCVLVVALASIAVILHHMKDEIKHTTDNINTAIVALQKSDSLQIIRSEEMVKKMKRMAPAPDVVKYIESVKSSVYYIVTKVYMQEGNSGAVLLSSLQGTGFLLNDGRFVTARHCVEAWLYPPCMASIYAESFPNEYKIWSEIYAFGPNGEKMVFNSRDFVIDRSEDEVEVYEYDEDDNPWKYIRFASYNEIQTEDGKLVLGKKSANGNDWAYVQTQKKGTIIANMELSGSLKAGTEVHVLGFPEGLGIDDGQEKRVEPIYNKMSVARNGLNRERCVMVSQGVAHGNSGGPVFVIQNGKIYAVAIVSRLEAKTQKFENGVIVQQQQQYDQLVPLKNLR